MASLVEVDGHHARSSSDVVGWCADADNRAGAGAPVCEVRQAADPGSRGAVTVTSVRDAVDQLVTKVGEPDEGLPFDDETKAAVRRDVAALVKQVRLLDARAILAAARESNMGGALGSYERGVVAGIERAAHLIANAVDKWDEEVPGGDQNVAG